MSDSLNISNTSDYSHSIGGNNIGNQSAKSSAGDATALHQGEIVRGVIIEMIDKELATVQLPNGTYKAVVKGKLQDGDTLLFKVQVTTPTLILKINDIPLNQEKKLTTENLLRLLDLPDDSNFRTLLETLKDYKSNINKDFVLSIISGYNLLSENQKKAKSATNLMKVLIEMKEGGFPLKPNLVEKLMPLFNTEDQIKDALIGLNQVKNELPYPLNDKLIKLLKLAEGSEPEFSELKNFFSLDLENENSFANLLVAITKNEDKNSLAMVKARAYAKLLLSTIEAVSLWNAFADDNSSGIHLIMPFILAGNLSVARMIVTRNSFAHHHSEETQDIAFTFTTNTENLGDINTEVLAGANQVHLAMKAENDEIKTILEKYKTDLQLMLESGNFNLKALRFGIFKKSNSPQRPGSNHLTVVI